MFLLPLKYILNINSSSYCERMANIGYIVPLPILYLWKVLFNDNNLFCQARHTTWAQLLTTS